MSDYIVTANLLNLRSSIEVSEKTKIAVLTQGTLVQKISVSPDDPAWWKISVLINANKIEGYVNSQYLQLKQDAEPVNPVSIISEVHLQTNSPVIRVSESRRAFALNEKKQPYRESTQPAQRVKEIGKIVDWLDVENSERYDPISTATYCNIYAYDYCYLNKVYLPRVWWMQSALMQLSKGQAVTVSYAKTVHELNANSLHDWFKEFGSLFGWSQTMSLDQLQDAANAGKVSIICAKRKDLNRSGHICAVVPETQEFVAKRKNNQVVIPLQSSAGRNNVKYSSAKVWWTSDEFAEFSFWIHE
jgi:hypothetical protein